MSFSDAIYIKSTHEGPEIMANFCHHAFDDFVLKVVGTIGNRRTTVNKSRFSIVAKPSNSPGFIKRMRMDEYGFVPNLLMQSSIVGAKRFWIKVNGEWDIPPLRDVILQGVIGLITTSDDSIVLFLDNPEREVLIRHAGELSLLEDPFWTEDRLLLFEKHPLHIKEPINRKKENTNKKAETMLGRNLRAMGVHFRIRAGPRICIGDRVESGRRDDSDCQQHRCLVL